MALQLLTDLRSLPRKRTIFCGHGTLRYTLAIHATLPFGAVVCKNTSGYKTRKGLLTGCPVFRSNLTCALMHRQRTILQIVEHKHTQLLISVLSDSFVEIHKLIRLCK